MTYRNKIVSVASGEIGVEEPLGDDKYIKWYGGLPLNAPWCAVFVSWCAHMSGIDETIIPKHASCTAGRQALLSLGAWRDRSYTPKKGDLIYLDFDFTGDCDHVGIVTDCSGGIITAVEGNREESVKEHYYTVNAPEIAGFGAPKYDERDNVPSDWAKEAVLWALREGILTGRDNGDLYLSQSATREEVITLLYRSIDRKGEHK